MATIHIDGRSFEVPDGQNLLAVCLALGFDLPFFCWHPAMGSVGACRQCAVKRFKGEDDTEGEIVMACLTPATDGTRISIQDPEARSFRASVTEWLMANHPHDCPVCDEGGECHLQDMTVMTGHYRRRYRFPKRTFENQDLGPFINHEMNRCIQCYRCVRFYCDYAGGDDLVAMGTHHEVYFGRHKDGRLKSEFSGNLVEVCPTGVFTDKTFRRHFTRKWDLQSAPSVCVHCGLGCNTLPGERYGVLRRVQSRYNGEVNGYFICDRGRFGYEFVNAGSRIRSAVAKDAAGRDHKVGGYEEAVRLVAGEIVGARTRQKRVIGIGSPRASLEANFALRRLVGADSFYLGISEQDRKLLAVVGEILTEGPSRSCSTRDLEQADAMLVLGEDVTNTAPMLAYSLRQWLRRRPTPEQIALNIPEWNDAAVGEFVHEVPSALHVLDVCETKLDRMAVETYHAVPSELTRLGLAVANLLDKQAPPVSGLGKEQKAHAADMAAAFKKARRPVIVSGISSGSEEVLRAAAAVAWALHARGAAAELCFVVPECNSLGASLLGGGSLEEAFAAAEKGEVDVALVLENDLYRRAPRAEVDRFLRACRRVVVLDHTAGDTALAADVVLPAGTFAESTGSLVNNEARVQRYYQVFPAAGEVRSSVSWLMDIEATVSDTAAGAAGEAAPPRLGGLDALVAEMVREHPVFAPLSSMTSPASYRVNRMKVPRQPLRYSGRTAMYADETVFEPAPPEDADSPLAFSMEGLPAGAPASLLPRYWSPGWNSVQALDLLQHGPDEPLAGGDGGARLIEPRVSGATPRYFKPPPPFTPPKEGHLVVAVHCIFGSEELSAHAEGIASCVTEPYVGLGPEEASSLGLEPGALVSIEGEGRSLVLPLRLVPGLPTGVAALPVGLPGLEYVHPPFAAKLVAISGPQAQPAAPTPAPTPAPAPTGEEQGRV